MPFARPLTPIALLLGISVMAALLLSSSPVLAAECPTSVSVNPSPVWQGGPITVSGSGWAIGTSIFINLDGKPLGSTTTNSSGAFSLTSTVPTDSSLGNDVGLFVHDGGTCEVLQKQEVMASQPVTTTTPPPPTTTSTTTTTTTTTTTLPVTTTAPATTVAPTTSAGPETTLPPATIAITADSQPSTSEETAGESSDSGTSPLLIGLLGALIGAGLLGGGIALGRRQKTD